MNNLLIEGLDDFGRGIAHINHKVVFIKNALPEEIVDIKIIKDKKNYSEGIVTNYRKLSPKRIQSKCPYFHLCGGCQLLHLDYQDTLDYKKKKVENLLHKNHIIYPDNLEIIKNEHPLNYRNKLSLKMVDGKIGFYEEESHNLVEIKECLIANEAINEMIKNYQLLRIKNGNLIVRTNSNQEILLVIETKEEEHILLEELKKKVKLIGIVYNHKCIYGNDFYYERINNKLFKVSYDSFFQVNPYITTKLFQLVANHMEEGSTILDLYSGVGTLSIVASSKAKQVYSIEIIQNAVLNSIQNAKLNNQNNLHFMLGDVSKSVSKIKEKIHTLIVDPPRSGLDKNTKKYILENKPQKIIYISCDIQTLIRDLKELEKDYEIKEYKILDMFSYTYHVECCSLLCLKESQKVK